MPSTLATVPAKAIIDVATLSGQLIQRHVVSNVITYIGSDPACDIVLSESAQQPIAKRHAQFICLPESEYPYRFLSLSSPVQPGETQRRETLFCPQYIKNGAQIQIGAYKLTFYIGRGATLLDQAGLPPTTSQPDPVDESEGRREEQVSKSMGLHLFLPTTKLKPGERIYGSVTVSNLGDQSGVKFWLKVKGLPEAIYILNAGPVLPLNASADINFYLDHTQRPEPKAGKYPFTIEVTTAEKAYENEAVTVSQVIEVLPFYKHELTLEKVRDG